MAKVEFLLRCKLDNITFDNLKSVKTEYFELLESNKFPAPPSTGEFSKMILYFKRKDENNPIAIGPYKNITPFEAANRIASDLVIINGLLQMIERKKLEFKHLTIRLGTTHVKDKGDFTIKNHDGTEEEGEAFNVAPSFFKSKLQKTLRKWKNGKLKYILVNSEAFEGHGKIDNEAIFEVNNWYQY